MEKDIKFYNKYLENSFKIALSKTKNYHISKDIASQVIYSLLLKIESIHPDKIDSWIYKTTINYVKKYFREKENEKELKENLKNKNLQNDNFSESFNYFYDSYINSLKKLNDNEKKLLNTYLNNDQDIKKTAEKLKEPYSKIQKRIFLIKKKIKAYSYQDFGYIFSKEILPPTINRVIYDFLNKFKKAISNKKIFILRKYFSSRELLYFNSEIYISKIKDYEIQLLNSNKYKIVVIYYNKKEILESFSLIFEVKKNHLKIISTPKRLTEIYTINITSKEGQQLLKLINSAKNKKDGSLDISDEIISNLLEQYEKRTDNN